MTGLYGGNISKALKNVQEGGRCGESIESVVLYSKGRVRTR